MVEPLFFTANAAKAKVGEHFTLDGEEGKHAATVRRMRIGEAIQLTDGQGHRVKGIISETGSGSVMVDVKSVLTEPKSKPQITLVQALAKGDRDELAIQAATELGIDAVIPWQANRSVSKWEGSKIAKSVARWQSIVAEASKQSLRSWIPSVTEPLTSNQLANQVKEFGSVLILDPTAQVSLADLHFDAASIALVVGPEGGIDSSELSRFEEAGARRVSLGSGILRTSTAGLAAISFIQAKTGAWNVAE